MSLPPKPPSRDSTARPLPIRQRGDLSVSPQWHRGQKYWVVKDPITLRYFHLRDEEYAIWKTLDGESSLANICQTFNHRFAPQRITANQVRGFLARLHRDGLVLTDAAGQGDQLIKRDRRHRSAQIRGAVTNFLAIRFPGVDPDRFLSWTDAAAKRFIQPATLLAVLLLAIAASVLFAVQYDFFLSQMPTLDAFLSMHRYGWLLVSLAAVKVVHELSHAMVCRRLGGECHEIGLMLLVFTPCLYCNVTDSWRFPSKWDRIAVAAAGMIAEVALASICTFLWWFTQPGLFHTLCMNIVIVCSISTLVLNGNPLLRYDGYFILADLIEIPNLWQKSRTALHGMLSRVCLGMETPADPRTPAGQVPTLTVYAAASMVYRAFVMSMIVWVVYRFLLVHRLEIFAQLFVLMLAGSVLALPAVGMFRLIRDPVRRKNVRFSRLTITAVVLALLLGCVMFVPLPSSVGGVATVESDAAVTVYVTQPGRLIEAVAPGSAVKPGDIIARLENPDIADEILELNGERKRAIRRQENLQTLRLQNARFAAEIPAILERIADLERRIAQRRKDAEELVLRAPVAGIVLSPLRNEPTDVDPAELHEWTGSPLDRENIGATLKSGTAICQVGRADRYHVISLIPESDIEFVRVGQSVNVVLEQHAGHTLTGKVVELAKVELKDLPPRFALDELPVAGQTSGRPTLLNAHYRARIALDDSESPPLHGSRGRVRIAVEPQTLGDRLARGVRNLFRFEIRQGLSQ